ncbi:MAG TPA: hypothetical protein VEO00_13460 [Actinomycetota bacterium]|nr:hypothetical protein [Actinomycetota bacterium]
MRRSLVMAAAIVAVVALLAGQALAADIIGTNGSDTIQGTPGNDNINGLNGHDTIYGNNGGDIILGSYGFDKLIGNDDPDTLYGNAGNDRLWGEVQLCGYTPSPARDDKGGGPTFTPCPGPDLDKFYGGNNNDVIHADDMPLFTTNQADPTIIGDPSQGEFVSCGAGSGDVAWVDNNDYARAQVNASPLFQTCETIVMNGQVQP